MTPFMVESPEFEIFAGVQGNLTNLETMVKQNRMKCFDLLERIEPFYFVQGIFPE